MKIVKRVVVEAIEDRNYRLAYHRMIYAENFLIDRKYIKSLKHEIQELQEFLEKLERGNR